MWCPGPDSNRHGVAPEGFSYPLQLSLLRTLRGHAFGVWTLPLPWRVPSGAALGRGRQVSTLSRGASAAGLSSGLQARDGAPVSPNLTPFTPGVSDPGAQCSQVPCVYRFRHPGKRAWPYGLYRLGRFEGRAMHMVPRGVRFAR